MPDASSAPDVTNATDARDPNAADVLSGDDAAPGGGALRREDAPAPRATGGAAPNAPVDTGVSAGEAAAEREAIAQAGERAPEPRPTST